MRIHFKHKGYHDPKTSKCHSTPCYFLPPTAKKSRTTSEKPKKSRRTRGKKTRNLANHMDHDYSKTPRKLQTWNVLSSSPTPSTQVVSTAYERFLTAECLQQHLGLGHLELSGRGVTLAGQRAAGHIQDSVTPSGVFL